MFQKNPSTPETLIRSVPLIRPPTINRKVNINPDPTFRVPAIYPSNGAPTETFRAQLDVSFMTYRDLCLISSSIPSNVNVTVLRLFEIYLFCFLFQLDCTINIIVLISLIFSF